MTVSNLRQPGKENLPQCGKECPAFVDMKMMDESREVAWGSLRRRQTKSYNQGHATAMGHALEDFR